jgi:hypothetical protein
VARYRVLLLRAAAWLTILLIIVLSLVPGQDRPHSGLPGGLEHLFAYGSAAMLLALGYPDRKTRLAVLAVVLSAALEIGQRWVQGRYPELAGFLASGSGVALGMLAGAMVAVRHGLRRW